jgi:hypothetical protein
VRCASLTKGHTGLFREGGKEGGREGRYLARGLVHLDAELSHVDKDRDDHQEHAEGAAEV